MILHIIAALGYIGLIYQITLMSFKNGYYEQKINHLRSKGKIDYEEYLKYIKVSESMWPWRRK